MLAFSAMQDHRLPLSVTIITLNEEKSLPRAIRSVPFAREIVVVDSGSTDQTREIAESMGARVISRAWEGYGQQKNHAHELTTQEWVLNIDADEEVSPELADEIRVKIEKAPQNLRGFMIPRLSHYLGRNIRHGGWYPNYLLRLSRKTGSRWSEPRVHEALTTDGSVEKLNSPLYHYPFGSIEDQVRANLRYAREGSLELRKKRKSGSIAKLIFKPLGKFLETYLWKRGFLDGLPGFIISINAAHSMFLKQAYCLMEYTKESEDADPHHR